MTLLANALETNSSLRPGVRAGIQALSAADRDRIAAKLRRRFGDSLDLDAALRDTHPRDPRWDYILSVPDADKLVGIEPHPARDSEVKVMIEKRRSALKHLSGHLAPNRVITDWYWVATGTSALNPTGHQFRALAASGITFVGNALRTL